MLSLVIHVGYEGDDIAENDKHHFMKQKNLFVILFYKTNML